MTTRADFDLPERRNQVIEPKDAGDVPVVLIPIGIVFGRSHFHWDWRGAGLCCGFPEAGDTCTFFAVAPDTFPADVNRHEVPLSSGIKSRGQRQDTAFPCREDESAMKTAGICADQLAQFEYITEPFAQFDKALCIHAAPPFSAHPIIPAGRGIAQNRKVKR